jgi:hypothetical protein
MFSHLAETAGIPAGKLDDFASDGTVVIGVGSEQLPCRTPVVRWVPLDAVAERLDEARHNAEQGPALIRQQLLDLVRVCRKDCRRPVRDVRQNRRVGVGLPACSAAAYCGIRSAAVISLRIAFLSCWQDPKNWSTFL